MKTRAVLLLAAAALAMPLTAHAQSKPKAHAALLGSAAPAKPAAMYACPICHHKVNAAQAKKLHYTCPVDQGKLALVTATRLHKPH